MKNKNNFLMKFATAAEKDAEDIIRHFVKKNKLSAEKGKKLLNTFMKSTAPARKQIAKIAKQNVSGRIKKARGILRLLDKSLGMLERNLRKIK